MTTRSSWYIVCDVCGDSGGWSHNEDTARAEVRGHGWIRQRDEQGKLVDMCWRCIERARDWATAPRIEWGGEG